MPNKLNTVVYSPNKTEFPKDYHVSYPEINSNSHLFYEDTLYIIDYPFSKDVENLINKIRIFARNPVIALVGEGTGCDIYVNQILDVVDIVEDKYRNLKVKISKKELLLISSEFVELKKYNHEEIYILEFLNIAYRHKDKLYFHLETLSEEFFHENRKQHVKSIMLENDTAFNFDGKFVVPFLEENVVKTISSKTLVKFRNVPYHVFNKLMCKVSKYINSDYKQNYFSLSNLEVYYHNGELFVYSDGDEDRVLIISTYIMLIHSFYKIKTVDFICEGINSERINSKINEIRIQDIIDHQIALDDFIGENACIVAKIRSKCEEDEEEGYYKFFINRPADLFEDSPEYLIISESRQKLNENESYKTFDQYEKTFGMENTRTPKIINGRNVLSFEWVGIIEEVKYSDGLEPYIDLYGRNRFYFPGSALNYVSEYKGSEDAFLCVNFLGSDTAKRDFLRNILHNERTKIGFYNTIINNTELEISDFEDRYENENLSDLFYRDQDLFVISQTGGNEREITRTKLSVDRIRKIYPTSEIVVIVSRSYINNSFIPRDIQELESMGIRNIFIIDSKNGRGSQNFRQFLIERANERTYYSEFEKMREKIRARNLVYITKEEFSAIVNNPEIEEKFTKYLIERKEIRDEGDVYIINSKLAFYLDILYKKFAHSKDQLKEIFYDTQEIRILRNFIVKYELGFYRDKILFIAGKAEGSVSNHGNRDVKNEVKSLTGFDVWSVTPYKIEVKDVNGFMMSIKLMCRLYKYLNVQRTHLGVLILEIDSKNFVIAPGFDKIYVFPLTNNYQLISYVLQIVRTVISECGEFQRISFDGYDDLFEKVHSKKKNYNQEFIDCTTTFFYKEINHGSMILSYEGKTRTVDIDYINALSNIKELLPSGKILYLTDHNDIKFPVSKKENFFEKWEVMRDLGVQLTEEEAGKGIFISSKINTILKNIVDCDITDYYYYSFGDSDEEFTEYKNDFGKIDMIRYRSEKDEEEKEKQLLRINFVGDMGIGKTTLIRNLTKSKFAHKDQTHSVSFHSISNGNKEIIISDAGSYESYIPINNLFYKNGDTFVIFASPRNENSPDMIQHKIKEIRMKFPLSPIAVCIPKHEGAESYQVVRTIIDMAQYVGITDILRVDPTSPNAFQEFKDFFEQNKSVIIEKVPSSFEELHKKLKSLSFLYMSKENFYPMLGDVKDKDKFIQYLIHRNFIREEDGNYINVVELISKLETLFTKDPSEKPDKTIFSDMQLEALWYPMSTNEFKVMKRFLFKYELAFFIDDEVHLYDSIPYKNLEIRGHTLIDDISRELNVNIQYKNHFEFNIYNSYFYEIRRKLLFRSAAYLFIDLELSSSELVVIGLGGDKFGIFFGTGIIYLVPFQEEYSLTSFILQLLKNIFDETMDEKVYPYLKYEEEDDLPASDLFSLIQEPENMESYQNEKLINSTTCFFLDHISGNTMVLKYDGKEKELPIDKKNIRYIKNK